MLWQRHCALRYAERSLRAEQSSGTALTDVTDFVALDAVESAAFADLYRAAPADIRTSLGIDVAAVGGATCLSSLRLQPAAIFRRACGLGVQLSASEAQLDEVVRYMDRLGETFAVTT